MREADMESFAMAVFDQMGYQTAWGPDLEPDGDAPERGSLSDTILWGRFEAALERVNRGRPEATPAAIGQAMLNFRRRLDEEPDLVRKNRLFQRMLIEGVPFDSVSGEGELAVRRGYRLRIVDRNDPSANDWLAVNQVVVDWDRNRRIPDIVVYLNGLPIAVFELKTFANEKVNLKQAYKQLNTYKKQIPNAFWTNQILVTSNGKFARVGSLTAGWERFMPWRSMGLIDGESDLVPDELEGVIRGLFQKDRLLHYIHDFVLFMSNSSGLAKIIAGYHQMDAAVNALDRTIEEVLTSEGRGRIGVVWHTQGSGKSLTMVFLAGMAARAPDLRNPTVIVITDRNDLDDQLFGTFNAASEYLGQQPVRIDNKGHLVEALSGRKTGGVIFSTIQKFLPKDEHGKMEQLSDRSNIIVIVDEAHRSQYDFLDGYASHLDAAFPNASFIGFTGTPIDFEDRDTREVFGKDISVYDLERSIEDGSTVQIYHQRAKIEIILGRQKEAIDEEFYELTEGLDDREVERVKRKNTKLDAIFGVQDRLDKLVKHMMPHMASRWETFPDGKVMVVCASRRICVRLHDMIVEQHPDWYSEDDMRGQVKVIMTGVASDSWQEHIRNPNRRKALGHRFRDPDSDFRVAIVCDMWLTGFDAPSLSTMYIDKPMKGHSLMQALARVNRAFADKTGGVVVDYYGLTRRIAEGVRKYTASNGRGDVVLDIGDAENNLMDKHDIVCSHFPGIDIGSYWGLGPIEMDRMKMSMLNRIYQLVDRDPQASRRRFGRNFAELNRAFNLAKTTAAARKVRDDIKLFQTLHGHINQRAPEEQRDPEMIDTRIEQILDDSVETGDLVEIIGLSEARSIFDKGWLSRVSEHQDKHSAQAALEQMMRGEIKELKKRNLYLSRKFSEMLDEAIDRYREGENDGIQDLIDQMVDIGLDINRQQQRGEELALSSGELAFYHALVNNEESVRKMGDDTLSQMAREIGEKVKEAAHGDWAISRSRQAKLRIAVKYILRKYNYPPKYRKGAVKFVLEQARLTAISIDDDDDDVAPAPAPIQ